MPLTSLAHMLDDAIRGGYGVCYCESWNLESMQAVVAAAEECCSPIVAGFNGGFLRHSSITRPEDLSFYAAMKFALERALVPIAFLLNESDSLAQLKQAMELGFNAVMPENEGLDLDQYKSLVQEVVEFAGPRNVWVEAQIGVLPHGVARNDGHSILTDPELARCFVEETGVHALAVSIGNVHILTDGQASVNLDVLRRVREKVRIPLVLHGGTSIAHANLRELAMLGVAKFNFGTVLKQAYLEAVRASLGRYQHPQNPHPFLGMGGDLDIIVAGREAVKQKVKQLLQACGSAGKAKR